MVEFDIQKANRKIPNLPISLEKHFSFITEDGPLLVAVSGGSDSIALLHLANTWAISQSREILAVTIDHGLRAESMAEAAFVANVCDKLNITHAILGWDGVKPDAGISQAARTARYRLIEEFCKDFGIGAVLTGHTRDDQAETINMRLQRDKGSSIKSGGRGLAGMCARTTLMSGCVLLRPLLGLTRNNLREYLKEISQSWIEDPSNFDRSYERVRVREKLGFNAVLKQNLVQFGDVMGRYRQVQADHAANLMGNCVSRGNGQVFHVDLFALNNAPEAIGILVLRAVIAIAGGAEYMASESKVNAVMREMGDTGSNIITKACLTLGNCIIERHQSHLLIYREVRNIKSIVVEPGDNAIWDGRLRVNNQSEEELHVGAMDEKSLAKLEDANGKSFNVLPRAVLYSCALVVTLSGEMVAPHIDEVERMTKLKLETCSKAIEAFCPQWDNGLVEWMKNMDQAKQKKASQY